MKERITKNYLHLIIFPNMEYNWLLGGNSGWQILTLRPSQVRGRSYIFARVSFSFQYGKLPENSNVSFEVSNV